MVDPESQGSALGILSFERIAMGGVSPIFAGLIYEHWGMDWVFVYAAALLIAAAALLMTVRLRKRETFVRTGHEHSDEHADEHGHGH